MIFAEPTWLIAGAVLIAALLFLYRRFDLRQRAALAEFASSHLLARLTASFSPARRWVKRGLFLGAVGFVCIALARPQWGYHWVEEKDRGIDILFAIDTSKSMLTQDVNPDRLTRAKMAITDFVRKLDGDRVGLIAFAGEAFLQAPLTLDYDAFQDSLDSIDVNTIPRGGTDIGSAIQEAQAAFGPGTHNKKILVLVTDGEDLEGQEIDAARMAAKDGLVIYTVGVGTASGGLIPVPNGNGGTDFVRDASGNFVKSHLDETTLSQIAEATGGMYQPLGQQGQGLGVIYDKALASMPKHDVASRRAKVYEEQYAWPLAAGLTLLLASMLIGTRRRLVRQGRRFAPARTAAGATALLALLSVPTLGHASAHSAERAYKKGQYDKAVSQFQDAAAQQPDVAPLQYDLGAAAYKSGQYDTALPAFQKALGSDDPALQQKAYYNIGNTEYRVGQKTVKAAPQETIKAWQSAVQSYDAALKLKADDADAKFNRDFVEKKLEKLEKEQPPQKQQQNQQQQQQQQQNQQQQNQQNQQNQNQQQNQQNQSQQNQQNQQGGQQGQPNQNQPQNGQNQAQNQPKNQNGEQPPSAADPNKQNGQQPQQTAGSQDQKQGGQQKQDQQNGNGQQQQTAQNQPKDGGAKDQAASADKDKQSGAEADASLPAGELTKEQAKDLLNSLKGEEHILPVAADTRSAHPKDQPVLKDW
jgi:Ca-activated chloride channel family protein